MFGYLQGCHGIMNCLGSLHLTCDAKKKDCTVRRGAYESSEIYSKGDLTRKRRNSVLWTSGCLRTVPFITFIFTQFMTMQERVFSNGY